MAIGRTNAGGGSGGLALKVIGSETQPSNPKYPTIWVKTDVPISGYEMSAVKWPSWGDMSTGFVYLTTATADSTTDNVINPFKKNALYVLSNLCWQNIGTPEAPVWAQKEAWLYNRVNEWVQLSSQNLPTTPPVYTYTGTSEFIEEDEGANWHLKLLTSGKLVFQAVNNAKEVEVFLVGGGGGGGSLKQAYSAGGGGGGGYVLSAEFSPVVSSEYMATIGAGGGSNANGGTTSIFELSAGGGAHGIADTVYGGGGAGGSGGGAGGGHGTAGGAGGTNGGNGGSTGDSGGKGAGVTTIPWGDESRYGRYAGGGGGGNNGKGSASGSEAPGAGGAGGGGRGANPYKDDAVAGTSNTGGGGGGTSGSYNAGAGGSGIIIIRNKRS